MKFINILLLLWAICCLSPLLGQDQASYKLAIDSLQATLTQTEQDSSKAKAYLQLSSLYSAVNELPNATQAAEQAYMYASKEKNDTRMTSAYILMGNIELTQSRYPEALKNYQKALDHQAKGGNYKQELFILQTIGKVHERQNDLNLAEKYYLQAYELSKTRPNIPSLSIAFILNNLGNINLLKQQYKEALDYQMQSLRLREESGSDANIGFSYNDLACIYQTMDSLPQAELYFGKALAIFKKQGTKWAMAAASQSLSGIYRSLGNKAKSKEMAENALNWARDVNGQETMLIAALQLSELSQEAGNYRDAYNYHVLYSAMRDSVYNEEKNKEVIRLESKRELDLKEAKNQLQQEEIENQRSITLLVASGLGLMLILALMLFRSQWMQKRANIALQQRNEEISSQKEEISMQAERLREANEEINQQKEELVAQAENLRAANIQVREAYADLNDKNLIIEKKSRDVTASIQYASRIQRALLPISSRIQKVLRQHFILFRPRDIVSGDFFWFAQIEEVAILAVVDCTGHGVPGALMSMLGNSALDDIVLRRKILDPGRILQEMHRNIQQTLNQEHTDNRDGMDAAICAIHLKSKTLQYAGAKNPLVYVKNEEMEIIKADRHSIGGSEERAAFQTHTLQWTSPITCYLYSDGYQDQFGGNEQRKLMAKEFRQLLHRASAQPIESQLPFLDNHLNAWIGPDGQQLDDILVIGFALE